VLEGGTRTPFITRWPGVIPAGESSQIVCTIDLVTSLAELVGVKVPDDACLDSLNILSALLGEKDGKGRAELLQQDNGTGGTRGSFGLRVGDWKLVRQKKPVAAAATISRNPLKQPKREETLYFLPDDPGEQKDLSTTNPTKTAELVKRLDDILISGRTR
jgi:arylsulfatase A